MRKRPEPQLLLSDLPEPRQAARLDDEEKHDKPAEDHVLEIGQHVDRYGKSEPQSGAIEEKRRQDEKGGAEERAEDAAEAADDHHEENLERAVDVEGERLDAAGIDERPQRPGNADVERADGKGRELGGKRLDADDLGGDVHVADRHPRAPDAAADQVLGGEGEDADEAQGEEILGDRAGFGAGDGGDAEDAARRRADHARGAVVKEPREFVEHPDEEELRRQRGDREIESLDAQAGEAEDDADRRRDEPGEEKDRYDIESGKAGGQLEGGEGADRHEAASAERELSGIAGEAADDGARDRGEAAEDEHGQRLQGDQRQRELHAEIAAPHNAGDEADDAGDRPDDDPDGLQRNADAERRLMVVGDRPQGAADGGLLEEDGEAGDQDAGDGGGDEIELVDQDAADDDRLLGNADVEHLDVAAPDELAEAVEEEGDADRRHEQDDRLLVDERAQHDALDDEGERHHHGDRRQEGQPYRHAEIDQPDEGQRREQHHDALGEVEHP